MRFRKFWEGCKVFPPRAVVGGWAGARTELFGSFCVALRRHWRILQVFVLPPESPEFVSPCLLFCNVVKIGAGFARVFRIVCF